MAASPGTIVDECPGVRRVCPSCGAALVVAAVHPTGRLILVEESTATAGSIILEGGGSVAHVIRVDETPPPTSRLHHPHVPARCHPRR